MSSSSESLSSEDEISENGNKKTLQPKKIIPVNNINGLHSKLQAMKLNLDWVERLDIVAKGSGSLKQDESEDKAEHDFKRELAFINQAQAAVNDALERLKKLGIPVKRPDDYFAEMAKSDAHMTKVREKLLSKQMILERTEKARALREQRKHGKQIQREMTQKKRSEKKVMLEALKKSKKGKLDVSTILDEKKSMNQQPRKKTAIQKNKEKFKSEKYGYGGRKKRSKYNTAESSAYFPGMEKGSSKMKYGGKGKQRQKGGRRRR